MSNTIFREARIEDAEDIYTLVQKTILTIYPHYYPKGVVDFFSDLHSLENISRDIAGEKICTFVVEENGQLLGTGSCQENHITRVFVEPAFQRMGYGSLIMQKLEDIIALDYEYSELDSSLAASLMYEKRGYQTVKHERIETGDGAILVYEVMQKFLRQ